MKTLCIFLILCVTLEQTYSSPIKMLNNSTKTNKKTTKYILNSKAYKNFKQLGDLDPNIDMSRWNPLKLNANQTGLLQQLNKGSCWKHSYTRTAGTVHSYCDVEKEDKEGSICYPKCDEPGYIGIGPRCWETCKPGYTDRGVFCIIDLDIYSKGCCCAIDDECCNNCNVSYVDDGCTCRRPPKSHSKKSYSRGDGSPLKCKPDEEESGLLCYPKCNSTYTGEGPVCWENCRNPFSFECGALCTVNNFNCGIKAISSVTSVFSGNAFSIFSYQSLYFLIYLQYVSKIPIEYLDFSCVFKE